MRSYLDFEKPVAELEAKVEELRAIGENRDAVSIGDDITRLEAKAADALRDLYCQPDALAEDAGRAPSAAAAFHRLLLRADHGFHAARRRPQIRRGRGDRRRLRALSRAGRLRPRPGEGRQHRDPHPAQFRHGQARGLPQGGSPDGAGRPFRTARPVLRRHGRRLSGHRGGGARPGRGHRALDRDAARASAFPTSRWSSARAARAAPSPSPRPTRC